MTSRRFEGSSKQQGPTSVSQETLWLFGSGPPDIEVVDTEERPKEVSELLEMLGPRRMVVKAVWAAGG